MLPRTKKVFNRTSAKIRKSKNQDDDYYSASSALRLMEEKGKSMDHQFPFKVSRSAIVLAKEAHDHLQEIEYLLQKSKILIHRPLYNEYLAKILIADLLWCNGSIRTNRKLRETEFVKKFEEQIQENYRAAIAAVKNHDRDIFPLPVYIRVNTLTISIEDAIDSFCQDGWIYVSSAQTYREHLQNVQNLNDNYFMKDFHISELLIFPPYTSFDNHAGYLTGKFVLQDKGSCLSSFLLNPKPETIVLDVGAGSGLKTNHLANIMQNRGKIVANDINPFRTSVLNELMDLTQVTCVKVHEGDFITATFEDWFNIQYILLDATSSNSGIFFDTSNSNKIPSTRLESQKFSLNMLLRIALQKFPNIKRVVYTTCSLYPEEGEEVVDDAMKTVGDSYTLLNVKEMLWNEWNNLSSRKYECGNKCLRTIPTSDFCLGYFIAVFERNYTVPVPKYERRFKIGTKTYTKNQIVAVPNGLNHRKKFLMPVKSYLKSDAVNVKLMAAQGLELPGEKVLARIAKRAEKRKRFKANKAKKQNDLKRNKIKENKNLIKTELPQNESIPSTSKDMNADIKI